MAVIFLKIKAKNAGIAVATASIFNAEIRKKNNISLSSLSGQSTQLKKGDCAHGQNMPQKRIKQKHQSQPASRFPRLDTTYGFPLFFKKIALSHYFLSRICRPEESGHKHKYFDGIIISVLFNDNVYSFTQTKFKEFVEC